MTASRAAALSAYASDADLRAAKMRMGEALPDDGWLRDYLMAVTPLTDAPVEFHLISGLCVISSAIGNQLYVESWGQNVYPHLWAVLVAPSSFWRKSTSINTAEALLRAAKADALLPSDFSREKFLRILADKPAGLLTVKEFGGFLAALGRDYMCVDAETEALTTTGWKRHDQLAVGDELVGLDQSGPTTLLRTAPVQAVNRYDVVDEPMVSVTGRSMSMLATANHSCVLLNQKRRPRADELKRFDRLLQVARWGGGFGSYGNSGDRRAKIRDRARAALLGWFLTDGWFEGTAIRFGQKTHPARLVEDLRRSEWTWVEGRQRGDGLRTFRLSGAGAAQLSAWAPAKLPPFSLLSAMGRQALMALFDAMLLGDGSRRDTHHGITFTQRPGPVLDFFQALALRLGYRTVATPNGTTHNVSVTRHRAFSLGPDSLGEERYTGVVWCPTSELGTFVARRRGRVFITGNSGMKENLTELYDGPDVFVRSLQSGNIEVKKPAVTILAATTLDWLESRITDGDLRGGFLARFLFVTAAHKASAKGLTQGMDHLARMRLVDGLAEIAARPGGKVEYAKGVRELLDEWMHGWEEEVGRTHHRSDLSGFAVRLQTYALKLAMIYRASSLIEDDGHAATVIDELSARQAIAYCRVLWANVAGLIDDEIAVTREAKELRRVAGIIGSGITRSDALKLSKMRAKDFDQVVDTLVQSGQVSREKRRSSEVGLERIRDSQIEWLAVHQPTAHGPSNGLAVLPFPGARGSLGIPGEPEGNRNGGEGEGTGRADLLSESSSSSTSLSHSTDESMDTRTREGTGTGEPQAVEGWDEL